ncbi:MAG: hypothetical protein ISR59_10580 [Anaerolineales bacterium]|nr:hypothetical protein [Anaerolineales bacterium]
MQALPSTKTSHTFEKFTTKNGARISRIPLEAFPGFWTYAYLVIADDHRVLIDTGSGFGDCNEHLLEGFDRVRTDEGPSAAIVNLTQFWRRSNVFF